MKMLLKFVSAVALVACQGFPTMADISHDRIIRLAEIEIDPSQVKRYEAALQEEIAAAIKLEPGVLTLYAVAIKGHPEQIRLFEMYVSQSAYESHLKSKHFLKYKTATQGMVRSLRLVETDPLFLGSK